LPKENFYNRQESPDKLPGNGMDTPTELGKKRDFTTLLMRSLKHGMKQIYRNSKYPSVTYENLSLKAIKKMKRPPFSDGLISILFI